MNRLVVVSALLAVGCCVANAVANGEHVGSSTSMKTSMGVDTHTVEVNPCPLWQVEVGGELRMRILRNYDRLERDKYLPQNVFLTEEQSGYWPGDTEGRTMLALVLDAQTSHREPKTVHQIFKLIPQHLNEKGYMGTIYPTGVMDEQQLSGNGWMLRALCEYYEWTKERRALDIAQTIVDSLFLAGEGLYKNYPIDPQLRATGAGAESGSFYAQTNGWRWSSDVGCVFIGMAGAIHAYQYIPSPRLGAVIDEMIARFFEIDLLRITAQTHASLTALRSIVRYATITDNAELIPQVEARWKIYKEFGMTENHSNYNWFERYDTWTEPCAVVDSYILAMQLWRVTRNPNYIAEAELIYYNAMGYAQRDNGGFGCDHCVGDARHSLSVSSDEAHWCCTMRGGEGLSRAAEYCYFTDRNSLFVTRFVDSRATIKVGRSLISVVQATQYPFSNVVDITLSDVVTAKAAKRSVSPERETIRINAMSDFVDNHVITVNGERADLVVERGFIVLDREWRKGDKISLTFSAKLRMEKPLNSVNCSSNQNKFYSGVLLLGSDGTDNLVIDELSNIEQSTPNRFKVRGTNSVMTPVYHLLNPEIHSGGVSKQILF